MGIISLDLLDPFLFWESVLAGVGRHGLSLSPGFRDRVSLQELSADFVGIGDLRVIRMPAIIVKFAEWVQWTISAILALGTKTFQSRGTLQVNSSTEWRENFSLLHVGPWPLPPR